MSGMKLAETLVHHGRTSDEAPTYAATLASWATPPTNDVQLGGIGAVGPTGGSTAPFPTGPIGPTGAASTGPNLWALVNVSTGTTVTVSPSTARTLDTFDESTFRMGRWDKFEILSRTSPAPFNECAWLSSSPHTLNPLGTSAAELECATDEGPLARSQRCLNAWTGRLLADTIARLGQQIAYLLEDEEDLSDLSSPPDTKSLDALLSYLASHRWIKAPSLTLSRNGRFVAHWRRANGERARISVEFIDGEHVRWSIADARDARAPTVVGGICSILELDEYLRHRRDWMLI
jgi:hypothetical protein